MGMDVYGKKPKKEVGEYFRRNVWGWHPLWQYCQNIHPEVADKVQYGHSNEGDGLGSRDSVKLAKLIKEDIRSGFAEEYIKERDKQLKLLPDENCAYCDENGNRVWTEKGLQVVRQCNSCSGTKKVRPFDTWYYLNLQDIKDFAEFLENSGGFMIC